MPVKTIAVVLLACMSGGCTYWRGNTYKAIGGKDELSMTADAVRQAQLENILSEGGPYTVFAPSNTAWNRLPSGTYQDLMQPANTQRLRNILMHHVVNGKYKAADLTTQQRLRTLSGGDLEVGREYGAPTINGILVVDPNIETTNGVIHVIDSVLTP